MAENLNEGKTKKELYDEQKALKLAQKEKELKKQQKEELKKNKGYVNPTSTIWGRILIWGLCASMVAGVIVGFIFAIINALK